MSVQNQIERIAGCVAEQVDIIRELKDALAGKAAGVQLPTLTNPGKASDMLSGKQLIGQDGAVVTGTIATKTASNLSASGATVTVPAGYYASQATKSVATETQATPSISVSSGGLITASATQSAGYVSSGTKSATKQLTTQAAKTVTPSTNSQTAVASGVYTTGAVTVAAIPSSYVKPTATKSATTYTPTTSNQTIAAGTYCSGAQTIKGDANLVAGNIKSGVSIFGVAGSYEGSGGGSGGGSVETCTVTITPDRWPAPDSPIYYYTDATTMTAQSLETQNATITVPKHSIIVISGWNSASNATGSCSQLFYNSMHAAYQITGDCTFTYRV